MEFIAEEVARAFIVLTKVGIRDALVLADQRMATNDTMWFQAMELAPETTRLDVPTKYHLNLIPETLKKPLNEFPNVSAACRMSSPSGDNADQTETAEYDLAIEAFMASRDADELSRITARYANALLQIAEDNPTLSGLTAPLAHQPTVTISSVVARRESTTTDRVDYMQGCRLDLIYLVDGVWKIK